MKRFSSQAGVLQTLDRYVGAPVCALFTAWRQLVGALGRSDAAAPVRSILFIKLAEQGSTVLAHEAIRTAVARVGRDQVYFLVFEENRFILDLLGLVPPENVLTVRTGSALAMAVSCLGRLREIRRRRFDACVDLEFFARFSAAIAFLGGARRRVGFHAYFGEGPYRGDLFTDRVLYNAHLHTSRTFTSLVLALDLTPGRLPTFPVVPSAGPGLPQFQPRAEETAEVRRVLGELGVPEGGRLILLNANASDLLPLRKWEAGNYAALAGRLLREFPEVRIGFTGAPEEASKVADLVRAVDSPRCICLAGRTTLRQLLVVYGLAELLVTNDSGPAHFAALTPIDVVSLFGPETPLLFAAPGPRSHPLWAGLACSPCVNAYNNRQTACRDNVCMQAITVDQVFETTCRIYRERTQAAAPVGPR
ncbi:MAG TPA: glycosyltransferase family 9 protein [Opitutaceae bacterium]|nr:glycosyltransferase family 9 protein [Opitutaceae bacterium]